MFKRLRNLLKSTTAARSYDAAKTVARYGDFSRSSMSANSELEVTLSVLRDRARGLYRNDPMIRRWVNQLQTNIVGSIGFKLPVRALSPSGNGGMDTYGNETIESEWADWCNSATADGMMTFRELTRQAIRTWARDGEFFVELVRGKRFKHGLALHAFEADYVDHTYSVQKSGNRNAVRQGVEIDSYGRPVAYYILHEHPGDTFAGDMAQRKHRRVPADRIIHMFIKDRPHQVRGEPPLAPIMTSTKMLSGYREAEITGRRVAASKMGFFTRLFKDGSGDIAPLATTESDDGDLEMEVTPGRLSSLPPGVGFEKFDMSTFSTDYEQFERQIMRTIAAGLDIEYANISMDNSNSSYSADRSAQIKQRDVWRDLQEFAKERFVAKVYAVWIQHLFDFGNINIPARKAEKFLKASYFTARGWSWVDPEKEIKATALALDRGITSMSRVASEQGRDVEEVFKEIQADAKLAAKYGVDLDKTTKPAKVSAP